MPKIYIPNKSGHDFSKAERFGDLVFITEGLVDKDETNMMQRIAEDALSDSESEDLIMPTGLTVLNGMIMAVFAVKHGRLNLLIHDAKKDDYFIRKQIIRQEQE